MKEFLNKAVRGYFLTKVLPLVLLINLLKTPHLLKKSGQNLRLIDSTKLIYMLAFSKGPKKVCVLSDFEQ